MDHTVYYDRLIGRSRYLDYLKKNKGLSGSAIKVMAENRRASAAEPTTYPDGPNYVTLVEGNTGYYRNFLRYKSIVNNINKMLVQNDMDKITFASVYKHLAKTPEEIENDIKNGD